MIRKISALVVTIALTGCASGLDKVDGLSVEIVDHGIFSKLDIEKAKVTDAKLETTDTVPYVIGTQYGLYFKVNGEPKGAQTNIKLQWAITPGSATTKRKLARLIEPRIRQVTVGEHGMMYVTIGQWRQNFRMPYKNLFFITDMNGSVLARHEFTVVAAGSENAD